MVGASCADKGSSLLIHVISTIPCRHCQVLMMTPQWLVRVQTRNKSCHEVRMSSSTTGYVEVGFRAVRSLIFHPSICCLLQCRRWQEIAWSCYDVCAFTELRMDLQTANYHAKRLRSENGQPVCVLVLRTSPVWPRRIKHAARSHGVRWKWSG